MPTAAQLDLICNLARDYAGLVSDFSPHLTVESLTVEGLSSTWTDYVRTFDIHRTSRFIDETIASVRLARTARAARDAAALVAADHAAGASYTAAAHEQIPEQIPDGHYAVEMAGEHQPLTFYRIRQPRSRGLAGVQYVHRMESDNARYLGAIRNGTTAAARIQAIMDAIRTAGLQAAAQRYGVEIGRCFCCNRQLTDVTSRSLGIGPDCRGARSRHAAWAGLNYSAQPISATAAPITEPQACSICGDVAVGKHSIGADAPSFCDECALDSDITLRVVFPRQIRRRVAAVA